MKKTILSIILLLLTMAVKAQDEFCSFVDSHGMRYYNASLCTYNLLGTPVGNDYKAIVIKNSNKMIRK